jgi:hypothetical protein
MNNKTIELSTLNSIKDNLTKDKAINLLVRYLLNKNGFSQSMFTWSPTVIIPGTRTLQNI